MIDRNLLGQIVREAWVNYCISIGDTKPSHLTPYDELSEDDKEADRRIGEAVQGAVLGEQVREQLFAWQWYPNLNCYCRITRNQMVYVAELDNGWVWYTTDRLGSRTSSEFGPFTSDDAAKADYEVTERTK